MLKIHSSLFLLLPFTCSRKKTYKFEEAKRAVCYATTLYLPDRTLPWTVKTDASKYGIGAVLTGMAVSTAPIPYLLASVFTVHGKVLSGR